MVKEGITRYYAAGKLISVAEKERIAEGKTDKVICSPKGLTGTPFVVKAGLFLKWKNNIDPDDPILKEIEEHVSLTLDKTFIIENETSLDDFATVYAYLDKGDL
jgi:hypothetical protein